MPAAVLSLHESVHEIEGSSHPGTAGRKLSVGRHGHDVELGSCLPSTSARYAQPRRAGNRSVLKVDVTRVEERHVEIVDTASFKDISPPAPRFAVDDDIIEEKDHEESRSPVRFLITEQDHREKPFSQTVPRPQS